MMNYADMMPRLTPSAPNVKGFYAAKQRSNERRQVAALDIRLRPRSTASKAASAKTAAAC